MASFALISGTSLSIPRSVHRPLNLRRKICVVSASSLTSSSSPESKGPSSGVPSATSSSSSSSAPFVESKGLNYAVASPNGNSPFIRFLRSSESSIERVISFSFFFLFLCFVSMLITSSKNFNDFACIVKLTNFALSVSFRSQKYA